MKRLFLFALVSLSLGAYAQSGIVAAGGDASNSSGSLSCSVGQPFAQVGDISEGLQHTYTVTSMPVGVEEMSLQFEVSVFPNPATEYIQVNTEGLQNLSFQLLSVNGKVLKQGNLSEVERIDMSSYTTGIYFIHISSGNSAQTFKIIKQ